MRTLGTGAALALADFDEAPPRIAVPAVRKGTALLFVSEDLDAPADSAISAPAPEPEPDPLPELLAAERAAGFAEGEAAGREAALRSQEAQAAAALRAAAAALSGAADRARDVAEAAAQEVARTALAALCAALPSLAERLGEAEVARFAAGLLPALAEEQHVTLRVAPELAPAISARFAHEARVEVIADAAVAPGDASIAWRGGSAERRAAAARAAIAETLASFGLS